MAGPHRALRQRNAALRQAADNVDLDAWDREFESAGLAISEARSRYVARVRPNLKAVAQSLLAADVIVEFVSGWPAGTDLSTILIERRAVDRARRSKTAGPHRADLQIRIGERRAMDTVSRGPQKLLAAA